MEVIPVEVKASNNSSVSLNNYIIKYAPSKCYKLINGNVGKNLNKLSIPHYMIIFV